ncbi:MAG: helix-turn-helix transcriptional regulator [Ferruginibacter sp.]|nr:helix-turn-helix transcriptional regulator [Ferruginibacter sp.]
MHFDFGFYSSLLLIFFVHGLIYSILLCRKSILNDSHSDKWLSFFLLLCSLYIAPWMLGFAGWYDTQPYRDFLFYIPFQQLYFIGPAIFFYIQSLLNPSFKFGKKDWFHLLPGMLYLFYSIIIVVTDKLILKEYYFLADGSDRDFDAWYQYSGFISMVLYFILSLRYYQLYKKLMKQVISYADVVLFKWVRNFLLAFLLMQLLQLAFYLFSNIFPFLTSYVGNWWYFFSFAIIFYYIAITGYSNSIETKVPFKLNLLANKPQLLLQSSSQFNAPDNSYPAPEIIEIEQVEIEKKEDKLLMVEWKSKITALLQGEKVYHDPELSLTQLAKMLKTNPSVISKVINQGFQLNFNDYINKYRVEAVKEKLQAGEQKLQTLLSIAFECGFNSKATFNRAFKKNTGFTPKDWIDRK